MWKRLRNLSAHRRFGAKSLAIVASSSLLAGFLTASGLDLTDSAGAQTIPPKVAAEAPVMERSFASVAEKLSPSVVNVKVTKVEKAGFGMPQIPDGPFRDYFDRFFGGEGGLPPGHPVQGAGSGVIISPDGTILTNNHVVEGAKEVTITLSDGREMKAKVAGRDPKTDLAVLKVEGEQDLPASVLGDSQDLRVGDWVLAIGNPFGLSHTVTSGIVSAKSRVIGAGPYDDFIQTDASINPGNSGGPLFNMKGEVVGINTAIVPNGQGIGFAIPINTAKPLIPQLVEKGEVTRGYIGVNIQDVTADFAKALRLDASEGALVADVVPGGPADQAGIRQGDVIVSFNGKGLKESHELPALVAAAPVGEEATVTILREGREKTLHIKVARLGAEELRADAADRPSGEKWGLELRELTPETAHRLGMKADCGVVVANVKPGSPADRASVRRGDVIVEVNRERVGSMEELKEKIARAGDKDSLLLLVQRGEGKIFIALTS